MNTKQLELRVANLDCEHDAANIERGLAGFAGLTELKIYPKSAKVALSFDPTQTNPGTLKEKLDSLGFPPQKGMEMAEQPKPWRNPKVLTSVVSGVLLLVGWLIGLAGAPEIVSTAIYLIAIVTIIVAIVILSRNGLHRVFHGAPRSQGRHDRGAGDGDVGQKVLVRPAGTVTATVPFGVGTTTLAPSAASAAGRGA